MLVQSNKMEIKVSYLKKSFFMLFLLSFIAIALTSCSLESKVVGKWEPKPGQGSHGVMTISKDNTFNYDAGMVGVVGTWSVEDGKLDMSVSINGSSSTVWTGEMDGSDLVLASRSGQEIIFVRKEE